MINTILEQARMVATPVLGAFLKQPEKRICRREMLIEIKHPDVNEVAVFSALTITYADDGSFLCTEPIQDPVLPEVHHRW